MTPISANQLRAIMPAAGDHARVFAGPLDAAMDHFSINTSARAPMFLAHVARESAQLVCTSENANYSAASLHSKWPSRFDLAAAGDYAHQPERICNRAYAGRFGNGDEASGDGWRYRGRAVLQITFKANYAECGAALGLDLVGNPDLLLVPDNAALAGAWFWSRHGLNALADAGNFPEITHRITGSYDDNAVRASLWETAKRVLAPNFQGE